MIKRKWITLLCCTVVGLAVGTSQVLKGLAQSAAGIPAPVAGEAADADANPDGLSPQALEQAVDASAPEAASEEAAPAAPAEEPAAEPPAAPAEEAAPEETAPPAPADEPAVTAAPDPQATEPAEESAEEPAPEAPAPGEASEPTPTQPNKTTAPSEPSVPTPTQPGETAAPTEPTAPTPTQPGETAAPSEPTAPTPAQPGETTASTEPSVSTEPTAETWAVTYVLRAGDAGTLPFDTAAVEKGRAIGAGRVPAPVLPDGIELSGYAVGGRVLTAAELAAYVPDRDTAVEVRTRKIEKQPVYDPSWDVPPAWAGSGRGYVRGNLSAAAEQRRLAGLLEERIRDVRSALKLSDAVEADMGTDHFAEVLAVYAVMSGQTDGFPYGVVIRDVTQLRHIYWSMTQVTGMSNHQTARIGVRRLSVAEAAGVLGLTAEQQARASELAASGAAAVRAWSDSSVLTHLSDEAVSSLEARIPQNISAARRSVLLAALSLENRVRYFWGGKSFGVGWDGRWGQLRQVTGSGDSSVGTVREMGLDCSGFVTWAFINGGGSSDILNYIGNGTSGQYVNAQPIAWNAVQPGDLLFYDTPAAGSDNHVGIVVTVRGDGTPQTVVHCADGSANGVVVTGAEGFKIARRPYIFNTSN